jgi:hypothetical protein
MIFNNAKTISMWMQLPKDQLNIEVKTLAMALIILMEKLAETSKQISTHSNSKLKSK